VKRREFIAGLGGAAAWPVGARTQQAMPVIGFINTASPEPFANLVRAFRDGLGKTGYIEGQNVAIEYRWAEGHGEKLPAFAADLIRRHVNVIAATGGSPAALAAKTATTQIPIVFMIGADPIDVGLVPSMSRPGGNITGAYMLAQELNSKRLQLLRELVPSAVLVGILVNPSGPGTISAMRDLSAATDMLRLQVRVVEANSESELGSAFAELRKSGANALLIVGDPLFNGLSKQLAMLALQNRLPSVYQFREFTVAGGLASYGGSIIDAYHQTGVYVGRILKGEKPSDLPVQQSTKVELFINRKTADALGVTIPLPLLGRADEVIE
jgi:putative ABC transport system substrate-binding protein